MFCFKRNAVIVAREPEKGKDRTIELVDIAKNRRKGAAVSHCMPSRCGARNHDIGSPNRLRNDARSPGIPYGQSLRVPWSCIRKPLSEIDYITDLTRFDCLGYAEMPGRDR